MYIHPFIPLLLLVVGLSQTMQSCQTATPPTQTDSVPRLVTLEDSTLMESSGLAFSQIHTEVLYTHEDSKCDNKIIAIDLDGNTRATIWLSGIENRDWEDIATVKHQDGQSYIYVAEIGDNSRQYERALLYRFPEPFNLEGELHVEVERLAYQYPEGPLNAECLLFDPILRDFWVVTKEKDSCGLYRLPVNIDQPLSSEVHLAERHLTLPFDKVTAGDISLDGAHILIRNKPDIYYWHRTNGETLAHTLKKTGKKIPHRKDHQSEGITIFPDNRGFVTSTEVSKKTDIKPYISIYSKRF